MPGVEPRCPWKIRYGASEETTSQCDQPEGHLEEPDSNGNHDGPGLAEFPYQRVNWPAGDRREYTGAWPGYCGGADFTAAAGRCVLPKFHAGDHAP
jgi:hypothetical protein